MLGLADVGPHIGAVIGDPAVLVAVEHDPGRQVGGLVQGVDAVFQELVGVLFCSSWVNSLFTASSISAMPRAMPREK